jgi:hypothetical protein
MVGSAERDEGHIFGSISLTYRFQIPRIFLGSLTKMHFPPPDVKNVNHPMNAKVEDRGIIKFLLNEGQKRPTFRN